MNHNQGDAGEDALAEIDLRTWRVPPPAAVHFPSLLVRALSPAATRAKRARVAWLLAAIVLLNAAIATVIVIVLARPPGTPSTVAVQPAGGGSVDAPMRDLLERLEQEQRELERKLAELEQLRALVVELSVKVRHYEQQDGRRERSVPKQRDRQAPDRIDHQAIAPSDNTRPSDLGSCDEVSCVLSNYEGTCCAKLRSPRAPITSNNPSTNGLPDTLDRASIANGIGSVKARIYACGDYATAKGKVKVRVHVGADGVVTSVSVEVTPDAALGACVAASVQKAVFPRTQNGGEFNYPFVF